MKQPSKYSEWGKIGAALWIKKCEEKRLNYAKTPKLCEQCGIALPYTKRRNRFCGHSCAATNLNPRGIGSRGRARQCINCNDSTINRLFCSNACKSIYQRRQNLMNGTISPITLKRIIIDRDGRKCSICLLTEWLNKPIGLILDHIDGHSENNILENLRLVCGNCDMQLPTYKSRNIGNGRHSRRKRYANGQSY